MTNPITELSGLEGVGSAVAAARDAADVIQRDRGRRMIPVETSALSLLWGAEASARLADPGDPGRWRPGAVRLSTRLIELAGLTVREPGQFLAQAHLLAARGLVAEGELGRIADPAAARRMVELFALLGQPGSALVRAALAHAEVATARPFGAGDALVARAVEHAVLIESGVDPRGVLPIEWAHERIGGYEAALRRYASGTVEGVRDWLLRSCDAVALAAELSPLAR